jgi:hypothetical protein
MSVSEVLEQLGPCVMASFSTSRVEYCLPPNTYISAYILTTLKHLFYIHAAQVPSLVLSDLSICIVNSRNNELTDSGESNQQKGRREGKPGELHCLVVTVVN